MTSSRSPRQRLAFTLAVLISSSALTADAAYAQIETAASNNGPMLIEAQGSFLIGGGTAVSPDGLLIYGDHAYVDYQVPAEPMSTPLIMWHGGGQSGKTWDTTADGREGYKQIFTRRGWPVYVIDEPRVGRAGSTLAPRQIDPNVDSANQMLFEAFRFGTWPAGGDPVYNAGVQFSRDQEDLEQFFRQATPPPISFGSVLLPDPATMEVPDEAFEVNDAPVMAVADLLDRIGSGILVTHSASGGGGWAVALATPGKVKGIISYEPGGFPFPEGELPAPDLGMEIPLDEFEELTRFPIQIVYGDYVEESPFYDAGLRGARSFVEAVNRHGGNAEVLVLPEIGITGNTHFPFADLNNVEVANLMSDWLARNDLDTK